MQFQSTLWTVIRRAREGDESALREFVLKYQAPVIAYCVRRGLRSDAEDVAQEVLLRVFRDGVLIKADPAKGRFRSLLLAVTRHVISKHLRHESAQKRGGGKVQSLGSIDLAADEPDDDFDREWVAHLIAVAVARLATEHPNYHEAVKLFLLEGKSYAEIAQELGRSPGELKNHIHRGKHKLIAYLRDQVRDYVGSHDALDAELGRLSRFFP